MTYQDTDHKSHFAVAASWAEDVNGTLRKSRQRAYWVAGGAALIAILEALALVLLIPLKTVVPYTITVDRHTGAAELARGIELGPMSESDALIQSVVAQYVLARETLDAVDLAANYHKVGLWSAGTARSDYLRALDRSNPASILHGANADTQIRVTIKSINLMSKTSAMVRFATDRREGNGPTTRTDWVVAMEFGFSGEPLSLEDRLLNPLGFKVSRYRRDNESTSLQMAGPQ